MTSTSDPTSDPLISSLLDSDSDGGGVGGNGSGSGNGNGGLDLSTLTALLGPGRQRSIARLIDYSPRHVSRVLSGRSGYTDRFAYKLVDAMGITMDDLRRYIAAQVASRL